MTIHAVWSSGVTVTSGGLCSTLLSVSYSLSQLLPCTFWLLPYRVIKDLPGNTLCAGVYRSSERRCPPPFLSSFFSVSLTSAL
jgi:hypothetical protein